MGLRIPEVDQHAVAHVLCDEATKPLHSLGDALLIGGDDLAGDVEVCPDASQLVQRECLPPLLATSAKVSREAK